MKAYRYLTGPCDTSFCHRVTDALNRGWQLHGPSSLVFDAESKQIVCGQAIVKEIEAVAYEPAVDLSKL